jgi:hypothetical protein
MVFRPGPALPKLAGRLHAVLATQAGKTTVSLFVRRVVGVQRATDLLATVRATLLGVAPVEQTPAATTPGSRERTAIRVLVVLILLCSTVSGFAVHAPTKCMPTQTRPANSGTPCVKGKELAPDLPGLALGKPVVYQAEIGFFVFVGALLVIMAVVVALFRGELPIEISTRGIRLGEKAATGTSKALVDNVEALGRRLIDVEKRIGP